MFQIFIVHTRSWTQGQKRLECHPFSQGVDLIFTAHTLMDSRSQKQKITTKLNRMYLVNDSKSSTQYLPHTRSWTQGHKKGLNVKLKVRIIGIFFQIFIVHTFVDSRSQKRLEFHPFVKGSSKYLPHTRLWTQCHKKGLNVSLFLKGSVFSFEQKGTFLSSTIKT